MIRQVLPVVLAAAVALPAAAPKIWAAPFSTTKIILEVNATDGDAGIQISVDAPGWTRLEVFDPAWQKILDVTGSGSVGMTGITELFFESAEPSFEDLPLEQLLDRFPEGLYLFEAVTVDGQRLTGRAMLSHAIPDGPIIVSPSEGAVVDPDRTVIRWDPVSTPFPGTDSPVAVVGYQIIVESVKQGRVFSVNLPATATQVKVPSAFMDPRTVYKVEVLAIESGGNQTISERSFRTQ